VKISDYRSELLLKEKAMGASAPTPALPFIPTTGWGILAFSRKGIQKLDFPTTLFCFFLDSLTDFIRHIGSITYQR
jgi:hypothetical protein